jgi:hypothetical protein
MTKAIDKTPSTEPVNVTIKSMKSSSDVVNFYRFIHENNLRGEAHKLMDTILKTIAPTKKRGRKSKKKLQ